MSPSMKHVVSRFAIIVFTSLSLASFLLTSSAESHPPVPKWCTSAGVAELSKAGLIKPWIEGLFAEVSDDVDWHSDLGALKGKQAVLKFFLDMYQQIPGHRVYARMLDPEKINIEARMCYARILETFTVAPHGAIIVNEVNGVLHWNDQGKIDKLMVTEARDMNEQIARAVAINAEGSSEDGSRSCKDEL